MTYVVTVDNPSPSELLDHVVRAAQRSEGLIFNNQYVNVTDARKLAWLVEAALPEFHHEVIDSEKACNQEEVS